MFSRYRQNVTAVSAIGTVTFLTCAYIYYYHRNDDVSRACARPLRPAADRRRRSVRDLLRRAGK